MDLPRHWTADFEYQLPPELIAQTPLQHRDRCRLLLLDRASGSTEHAHFSDLPELLHPGDLLVLNDSRVLPARLDGRKPSGGRVEVLLTRQTTPRTWLGLTRPGLRVGQSVDFRDGLAARVELVESDGQRRLEFDRSGPALDDILHQIATMPVPRYVRQTLDRPDDY